MWNYTIRNHIKEELKLDNNESKYKDLNDYELVSLAQENNEDAINLLHQKYKPIIEKKSKNVYKVVSKKGVELLDIIQECTIGFEEAIKFFQQDDDVTFYTFCNVCMDRQLKSVITRLNRDKYKILNEAIPIDNISTIGDEISFENIMASEKYNPEKDILFHEKTIDYINKIKLELTNFEECVFDLKLEGFDYKEISIILDKTPKAIDNAIQRIRTKVKKVLDNTKN
jgi:RNA polymerase sporulation-specific sigma factor